MKKYIIILCSSLILMGILTGCLKKIDQFNSNTITVTFANSGPKFITQNATVNPKDSIQFNFTVTCPTDMKYVTLTKNGITNEITRDTIKTGSLRSFTAIKKLVADSVAGDYNYKVVARDAAGYYLGSASIVVTVVSDFIYYTNKTVFVPDTVSKTNLTYFASSTGATYSYTSAGVANSGLIDFGYYYNPDSAQTAGVKKAPFGHFIYALNVAPTPNPISFYDISTWTKNATIFKIAATPTYASVLSLGGIKSGCITNLKTGAASSVPTVTTAISAGKQTDTYTPLVAGNVIWFKTAAGKYGVIQINYINQNSAAKGTYMNFEVKMQP